MRIVYFIDHLRADGTQRVLSQLVEGLKQRGHDQAIVVLNNSYDDLLLTHLRQSQAEVRIVGIGMLISGYGIATTLRWLRRNRFDVAVTLLFASDVLGRWMVRTVHIPRIVSSLRARNTHYAWWQRRLVRYTMRWVDAVILNSALVRDFAIAEEAAVPERMVVIPNGVEIEPYQLPISRALLRAELQLAGERPLVASVGRLSYQKGFDILIQACSLLPKHAIDLILIGQGAQEAALRQQVSRLGLEQCIHFVGYRHDIPHLLGALDLYVHAARWEGMPNALMEAMAAGCPIVASAVDGVCELIEDGIQGWLVPPENPERLAQAIQAALSDPLEAQRRATAAHLRVATHFNVETMVAHWEEVLNGTHPCVRSSFSL